MSVECFRSIRRHRFLSVDCLGGAGVAMQIPGVEKNYAKVLNDREQAR